MIKNSQVLTPTIPWHVKIKMMVTTSALALISLGSFVLFIWHHPGFSSSYNDIIVMSYNTAICTIISGLALLGLIHKRAWLLKLCATFNLSISGLTLVELFTGVSVHVHYWFMQNLENIPANAGLMSPTSGTCLFLANLSLLLLGNNLNLEKNHRIIAAVFLNLMTITIAIIALLGHGIGLVPAFVWLGIKMASHTAVGLALLSSTIIFYIHHYAIEAFNRLNFFSRMMVGFGFMAILVICIGSIAFMQINTVSAITHELYQNPLQINNAADRIKSEINTINRQLKNIAIRPEVIGYELLPKQIDSAEEKILADINIIKQYEPALAKDANALMLGFKDWKKYVLESYDLLNKKAYESYSSRILYDSQEQVIDLENILNHINHQAQTHITNLDKSVIDVEQDAKKLVVVIVAGFLIIGITVASFITRSLTRQLQAICRAMQNIANEQIDYPIPFLDHTQEIGDMARTLSTFAGNMSARRQLETRLRQVIETMPNGIIMVNKSGAIEIVNAQAEKIFGYERSELLGQQVEQLIPGKLAAEHPHNRDSFFKNPSPRIMGAGRELFGLRRDGTEFPLEIGLAPVETEEGMKVLASIVDITERRNAAIALNQSRERLELTTRINQIGVWEYDTGNNILIWDDTMFEIYGRSKEYFTAEYAMWRQSVHPDDIERTEKQLQESLDTLSPFISKFRIIQPDGNIKHILAKAKVERRDGTNESRILGTNIDITREEIAVAKLHNLEALRSAIVEFSEDAIISKTSHGIVTSWNSGAHSMFGYTEEEVIGKSITPLIFPADSANDEEALLTQVRAGSVVKHFETVCRRKDGSFLNVSITLSPIKDTSGNVIGISAIKRDITESLKSTLLLAERQQELESSNRDLERTNKELETFAYVASHDLKSPLRGIAQLSAWIEEDIEAKQYNEVGSHTEMLRNRIKRMEKLLDDLLIFYRAGKVDGAHIEVNVETMARDLFDIHNTKPGLRLELGKKLPTFLTLSVPLEQIIRNLFSNAIKHHDLNQGVIIFDCKDINDDFFEFRVCDDGPGIPDKFQQRIFGMFQTLKPRDELEGSGMGLALIKKITENYGGQITLKSEGRGSCFFFTWPKNILRRQEND